MGGGMRLVGRRGLGECGAFVEVGRRPVEERSGDGPNPKQITLRHGQKSRR